MKTCKRPGCGDSEEMHNAYSADDWPWHRTTHCVRLGCDCPEFQAMSEYGAIATIFVHRLFLISRETKDEVLLAYCNLIADDPEKWDDHLVALVRVLAENRRYSVDQIGRLQSQLVRVETERLRLHTQFFEYQWKDIAGHILPDKKKSWWERLTSFVNGDK